MREQLEAGQGKVSVGGHPGTVEELLAAPEAGPESEADPQGDAGKP